MKNINAPERLSPAHLKIDMPKDVSYIIQTLYNHGYEAFAVGGCVRDALLGRKAHDWDITTSAKPEQVKELFFRTIDTGIAHGTVTIMLNRVGYEVTTYRIDGEYEDARHPKEVTFTSSLIEDLKRRDFTINAMAYNDREGLVDAFDGIGDLQNKIIRCVGNPEDRFGEDALRMLRAVRFAAQLGFTIDPATSAAVKKMAKTISKVSAERIQVELVKMLTSDHPEEIRTAYELGLTAVFFPEFDTMMQTPQHTKHHCANVGEHTILTMQHIFPEKRLRLTMLLHDVAKPCTRTTDAEGHDHFRHHPEIGAEMAEKILRRWKLDNDTINRCCLLIRWHDDRPPVTERNIRRAMNRIGEESIPELLLVKHADMMGQSMYHRHEKQQYLQDYDKEYRMILAKHQCVQKKDMAVSGKDLINLGIKPGKMMGTILEDLFQQVLEEPDLNKKETLLEIVKTKYFS